MNETQELIEAYEKFKEVDKNFMVGMKAKNFNVDQKLLAFVFQQMQGCSLREFREFARAINATATRIIERVPVAYTPVESAEYQETLDALSTLIDKAAERKLLEQRNNGSDGTGDSGNSTGDGAALDDKDSLFRRIFG